jgi:hypothetical protein
MKHMSEFYPGDSVTVSSLNWDHKEPGQVVSVSTESVKVELGGGVLSFDASTLRGSDERWGPSIWIEPSPAG